MNYLGLSIALGCALSWAIAVVLWRKAGPGISARGLNLYKNTLSLALMIPTAILIENSLFAPMSQSDLILLIVSGMVGIGFSDTLYLWSLELIGASRLAIIDCLYSPSIIFVAWLFLGETLNLTQAMGALCVLAGVAIVAVNDPMDRVAKKKLLKGSIICAIAIMSMAMGIVFVKPAFDRVPLFQVITIRLAAGTLVSFASVVFANDRKAIFKSIIDFPDKLKITLGSLFGTYISMLLWVAGFKYNDASIAAILNQMTTIFTVILAGIYLEEPLTKRKLIATTVAVTGVMIITLNGN